MIELIGWIGAFLFAACAVPQAYQSWKQGHSDGISIPFLILWFSGEVISLMYQLLAVQDSPTIFNYLINFSCLLIIFRYRIWSRKRS